MITRVAPTEFLIKYKQLHDSIFSGRLVYQRPFQSLDWDLILIPGRQRFGVEFSDALEKAGRGCGDHNVIVTDFEPATATPHQYSIVMEWDSKAFWEIGRELPCLISTNYHVFGRSGQWGMICYFDDFSCVGGTESFMQTITGQLGGKDTLRQQFLDHAQQEGWLLTNELVQQILAAAGWNR